MDPQLSISTHEGGTSVFQGREVEMLKSAFTIVAGERFFDVLDIAEDCMHTWDRYLQDLRQRAVERGLLAR